MNGGELRRHSVKKDVVKNFPEANAILNITVQPFSVVSGGGGGGSVYNGSGSLSVSHVSSATRFYVFGFPSILKVES